MASVERNMRVGVEVDRLGGTSGNTALTAATAVLLTLLLAAEGVTILDLSGLRSPHMFIGMLLLGPVLLKLGSTGYRFARYYTGARPYRQKGPPELPLRLLAPLLVATTLGVFGTGVALLIIGHRSGSLVEIHKICFIVWSAFFAVHFLAHTPGMVRATGVDFTRAGRRDVPGSSARLALLAGALSAGLILALALLSSISGWHGGR
jgi:hypothetical protein